MIEIWMESMLLIETMFGMFCILIFLQWNIEMDEWILDKESQLGKVMCAPNLCIFFFF